MTAEMVAKARANRRKTPSDNVEFRLGEIEHLPVADSSVDVLMSNCVINLSTDKPSVFREAFRVLVPGGRLAIADIVAVSDLPSSLRADLNAYAGCVAGAALLPDVIRMLTEAGFQGVAVDVRPDGRAPVHEGAEDPHALDVVVSALIRAQKPIADESRG